MSFIERFRAKPFPPFQNETGLPWRTHAYHKEIKAAVSPIAPHYYGQFGVELTPLVNVAFADAYFHYKYIPDSTKRTSKEKIQIDEESFHQLADFYFEHLLTELTPAFEHQALNTNLVLFGDINSHIEDIRADFRTLLTLGQKERNRATNKREIDFRKKSYVGRLKSRIQALQDFGDFTKTTSTGGGLPDRSNGNVSD